MTNVIPAFSAPVKTRVVLQNRRNESRCYNLKRVLVVCGQNRRTTGFGASETKATGIESDELENWAGSKNVEIGKVQLSTFDNLRGMRATERIETNSALLSVPSDIAISVNTLDVSRSPFPETVSTGVWKVLAWYGRLALKLYLKRDDPVWKKWISLLPKSFDTPLHWKDSDIDELQSVEMIRVIKKQKGIYREMFNKVSKEIATMRYEDFAWALDCVLSRSFEGPCEVASFRDRLQLGLFILANTFIWPSFGILDLNQSFNGGLTAMFSLVAYDFLMPRILKSVQGVQLRRYALAPGIDFFNHSCRTNAEVAFEYFRDKFVVRSRNTYDKGDQVFVSYGKKNNDTLLLYYGFVELDNLNEEYVFGEAVAKALNFPPGTLRLDRDGSVSDGTKKVISKSFKGRERETFEVLKKLCKAELAQFPTSVEEDEKLWDEPKLDERGKVAIVYRMSKKRILEAACNKLETIA